MTAGNDARAERTRPVTRARIEAHLLTRGFRTEVGTEGSLLRTSDGLHFTISLVGEPSTVVRVRGTWPRTLDAELTPGIAQVVNDWNRDRIWPKVFTREHGGGLRLVTDVTVDLADGATDAQLAEVIACGLGTGSQFFAALGDLIDTVLLPDGPPTEGPDGDQPDPFGR